MVQSLSDYISQLQRSGYSSQMIRAHLSRSGYSAEQIARAISPVGSRLNFVSSKKFIIPFVLVVLLSVLFFFVFFRASSVSLELRIPSVLSFHAGDIVSFEKIIYSLQEKTSVGVLYEVVSQSGGVVVSRREKLVISGQSRSQSRISLPAILSGGSYVMKVSLSFDGLSLSKSFSFEVVAVTVPATVQNTTVSSVITHVPVVEVSCPVACVSDAPCVSGACVNGLCQFEKLGNCCGNGKCEFSEDEFNCVLDCAVKRELRENVLSTAKSVVKSDASKAVILCNSLVEDLYVDECVNILSRESNNSVLCNSVRGVDSRDSCFMNFALAGDFSVCDKISDRNMAVSCNYLSEVHKFSKS